MFEVLLVEDDTQLNKVVKKILEHKGFIVTTCEDGKCAKELIEKKDFDLYLIDINIPYVDGIELVKIIKSLNKRGNIIMITASLEEENFEKAYEYGCDDYIKKPFHMTELEVRIRHLLKETLRFDDYEYNFKTGDLFKNSIPLNLRKKEKKLLEILLKNKNLTVSNDVIVKHVWGEDKKNPPIRQLVNELRKKFDKDYIKTVVGLGYRFEI